MRRKNAILSLIFWILGTAVSCNKDDGKNNGGSSGSAVMKTKIDVDLTGVQAFLIGAKNSAGALLAGDEGEGPSDSLVEEIYAVNKDGTLTIVQIYDIEGDVTTTTASHNPKSMNNTQKYTLFSYDGVNAPDGRNCRSVALRKSDGALFCIETSANTSPDYNGAVKAGESGERIFINTNAEGLWVLDFTTPEPTLKLMVDPDADGSVQSFAVNKDGDVILSLRSLTGSLSVKIYLADGGFQNVLASEGECLTEGVGDDRNNFYYLKYANANTTSYTVQKMTKEAGKFIESIHFDDSAGTVGIRGCVSGGSLAKTGSKIFFLQGSIGGTNSNFFVELINGGTPVVHNVEGFAKVERLAGYDQGLIVQGTDAQGNAGVKRFRIEGDLFSDILKPGDYTIGKLSASGDGAATFSGRRAADNSRIVGNVTGDDSEVKIIFKSLTSDVQFVERLN